MAVVVGGALACLECGLDYAEGKITKREMVQRVVRAGVMDGGGAFFTTGIIVGISLVFPFMIPILTPVLIVLQGASFALMGARGVKLAKGWWAVLERQQLPVYSSFGEAVKAIPMRAKDLSATANGSIIRTGSSTHWCGARAGHSGRQARFSQDGQTEGKRGFGMTVLRRHIEGHNSRESNHRLLFGAWSPDKWGSHVWIEQCQIANNEKQNGWNIGGSGH